MPQFAELNSMVVGDVKITYLPDGGGLMDPLAVFNTSRPEDWQPLSAFLDETGKLVMSMGICLVEAGHRKILVDAGVGPAPIQLRHFGSVLAGTLLDSLRAAGQAPDVITDVIFTHLHIDHIGWTSLEVDGERRLTFPKARHWVSRVEWEYWYDRRGPAGVHQRAMEHQVALVDDGQTIVPGISAIATPGHTPGHMSLLMTSGSQRVYFVADVLFSEVQLRHPMWLAAFDMDATEAGRSREKLLKELIQPNTVVVASHFPDHVFGRIEAGDGRYQWRPALSVAAVAGL